MSDPKREWLCPWCDRLATAPLPFQVISESRKCECGAIALGAPAHDTDEIIDDAISVFGIADGYMTPFDADRVAGLQKVGVELAEGQPGVPSSSHYSDYRVLWFRRKAEQAK